MGGQDNTHGTTRAVAEQETISSCSWTGQAAAVPFLVKPEAIAVLLAENVDDYMSLGLFTYLLSVSGPVRAGDLRLQCLAYLDHMIGEEYVLVGTVVENVFLPWVLGAAQIREAIAGEWAAEGPADYETLRDIAWLKNTPKGDDVARAYLERARSAFGQPVPQLAGELTAMERAVQREEKTRPT